MEKGGQRFFSKGIKGKIPAKPTPPRSLKISVEVTLFVAANSCQTSQEYKSPPGFDQLIGKELLISLRMALMEERKLQNCGLIKS